MNDFPRNVQATHRMQVVDVSAVTIRGVLAEIYEEDEPMNGWRLTDGDDVASLTEWLDAFEGKNVIVTIKLASANDVGASLRKKVVEQTL